MIKDRPIFRRIALLSNLIKRECTGVMDRPNALSFPDHAHRQPFGKGAATETAATQKSFYTGIAMHDVISFHEVKMSPGRKSSDVMFPESALQGPKTWQARRVEQYIETHWDQPITIEVLARATAASARSIFHHFRSCRGQTPMAFLKQVRLQHAKEMLEKTNLNRSVTDTAIACGFGNLGHFASDYFKRYGEHPSDTLKRGKYEFVSHP
jgi:AraC-like DNA-binding protein